MVRQMVDWTKEKTELKERLLVTIENIDKIDNDDDSDTTDFQ